MHRSISPAARLPSGFGLAELRAPAAVASKTLSQLDLRRSHSLTVVAVTRGDKTLDPSPEFAFQDGDHVLVAGRTERLDALARAWDVKA